MKIEKIKEIPKYIWKRIEKKDKSITHTQEGRTRYYSYLTKNDGELVKVTVAVKGYKGELYRKQVAVHGLDSDYGFVRDMAYHYISGYQVGWYDTGTTKKEKFYEDGNFYPCRADMFDPYAIPVNNDYALNMPQYKYSGLDYFTGDDTIKYLSLYSQYPVIEMLAKIGLSSVFSSITLLKTLTNDKTFRKWIFKNKDTIIEKRLSPAFILNTYKGKTTLANTTQIRDLRRLIKRDKKYQILPKLFNGNYCKLLDYIEKQNSNIHYYADYIHACKSLNMDLSLPRNYIPHNLKYWHDYRIDEYCTQFALTDEKEKAEHYKKFAAISKKYDKLKEYKSDGYQVLLAQSPADLFREGMHLHHCVGNGAYDQRVIREESLIFFLRKNEEVDIPYATIEYSLLQKKVLQLYIFNDEKPSATIQDLINNKWTNYAKKQLRKIA